MQKNPKFNAFFCVVAAVFGIVWLEAGASSAAPSLRVRSQTRIEARATRSHGSLVIQGQIKDDLDAPLGGQPVVIALREEGSNGKGIALGEPEAPGAPCEHGNPPSFSPSGEGASALLRSDSDSGRFCVRF